MTTSDIVSSLRGKSFSIPDFYRIYHHWPVSVSPHIDWLRDKVNAYTDSIFAQQLRFPCADPIRKRKEVEAINVAYLVSSWWPCADSEVLLRLAYCSLWLFIWDDESEGSHSSCEANAESAQRFRDETREYARRLLNVGPTTAYTNLTPAPTNVLITAFADVAAPVASKDEEQQARFYEEVAFYIHATGTEAARRAKPNLPALDDYLGLRIGTSGVRVLAILFDILSGPAFKSLPPSAYSRTRNSALAANPSLTDYYSCDDDLDLITDQCNLLISITNDILSLKKELRIGIADSAIPILFSLTRDLDEAMKHTVEILESSKQVFDEAEQRVLTRLGIAGDEEKRARTKKYIDSLKTMVTGNVAWSMRSERYGLTEMKGKEKRVVFL